MTGYAQLNCRVSFSFHAGAKDFAATLGPEYQKTRSLRTGPPKELCADLLSQFSAFQLRAKSAHEQMEATRQPVEACLYLWIRGII